MVKDLNVKVNPKTEFIRKVVEDLGLEISDNGILIIPDYLFDGKNIENIIILKTHNYDLGLVERIEDRYLQIIQSIQKYLNK